MPTPTTASLRAVWGWADGSALAVGSGGTVIRYDGAAWTSVTVPTTVDLAAVWGESADAVLVGGQGGLILRQTPAGWDDISLQGEGDVTCLWGDAQLGTFAGSTDGHVYTWQGDRWDPSSESSISAIRALWGDAATGEVVAVGGRGRGLVRAGGKWQDLLLSYQYNRQLMGLWGSPSDGLVAVGTNGVIFHLAP